MTRNQVFAACATIAVVIGLALGFREAGSPALQRLANADQARVEDLNAISRAVGRHHAAYGKLPQGLAELGGTSPLLRLSDPDTGVLYDYRPLDEHRFELCAIFSTNTRTEALRSPRGRPHNAGRQCFTYPE